MNQSDDLLPNAITSVERPKPTVPKLQGIENTLTDSTKKTKTCPHCQAVLPSDMSLCSSCGEDLSPDPLMGKIIDDRYEVIRRLGSGAMGAVYEVRHLRLSKRFAMKVIHRELTQVTEFVTRFEREALSMSRLQHPNCITVTDFGHASTGELYLVMEYLEGRPLSDCFAQPIPVRTALEITRQILLGVQHAHQAGVIHRDLKPENVMRAETSDGSWQIKVVDFGIAKLPMGDSNKEPLTKAGVIFGTPQYMAPEQALGTEVSERTDLYAIGVILWRMLTGRPLFEMEGHMEVLSAKLSKPAPLLDNVVPGIFSLSLQKLLCRALERNPSDRIVSAQAFLDAIHRIENEPGHGLAIAPATKQLLKVAVRRVTVLPQLFKQYLSDWFRCEEQKPSEPTWRLRLEGLWTTTAGRKTIAFSSIPLVVLCLIGFLILSAVGENEPTLKTHKDTHPKLSSNVSLNSRPRVSSGISNLPPNSNQQRPTNARSPLDSRLARARKLLASNACREATSELSQVLRRNPKLAGGYYLLGNALICRKMYREGLNAYAEAIRLDPNYRQDDKILKDAERLLKVTKLKTTVVDFLDSKMGPSALPLLVKVGSYYSKETLRHRARDLVVKQGASNQIDWFASLVLDFKQEKSCKKRGVIVNQLKKLKDPRAIPFLRQARDERTGFWGNKYKNWCIRSQLVEALKELQSQ